MADPAATRPRVDAIIVNYHQPGLTQAAIRSFLDSDGIDPRVILIENEGDGAWAGDLLAREPRIELIANRANVGFGAACNQGFAAVLRGDAQFVLLLNNDAAAATADAVLRLIDPAARAGLAAPRILLPDGRIYAAGGRVEPWRARCRNRGFHEPDAGQYDRPNETPFASACALLIHRRVLEAGLRFHAPYFLYYEDADFCLAARRAGFRIRYVPESRFIHHESASTAAPLRPRLLFYTTRNRLLFLRRNYGWPIRLVGGVYLAGVVAVRQIVGPLRGRGDAARATARGYLAGLGLLSGADK
ncbi:MAG: N-acetylglucosaminyl-diphospho-decaprenol L-rhamnosyltransferase [candidate division BRC1 bacterium ADurb.BinA292]|nr:MAG: N-acetylglucosaminyl-diphospho-decaprenol L-rhamnosyltransferase [candidate division BRC1 bacterium ADurb.BinA292]